MEFMSSQDDKISWLFSEIQRWVREGIIDSTAAESIGRLYPQPQSKTSRPWALIVFSGIGAVIIGLGIILLFAYNWHDMTKFTKLSVVFGSLILAHFIGITLFIRSDRFKGIGEALCVLGTMLFGAGIWLVAQIYHIEEHFPNAFLLWGIGALLMAWTMPSIIQAIIAAVLFTIWAATESVEFSTAMPYVFALLLLLLPIVYTQCSRILLAVLLSAFTVSAIFVFAIYDRAEPVFYCLLCVFAIYTAASMMQQKFAGFEILTPIYFFFGMTGYFITLYILTFPFILNEIVEQKLNELNIFYKIVPLAIMAAGWLFVGWQVVKKEKLKYFSYELFLMPLMSVFFTCVSLGIIKYTAYSAGYHHDTVIRGSSYPNIVFNLVLLAHAVVMMAKGYKDLVLSQTIVGTLLLIALVIARYFDLFESLAVRGLIFVIVGVLIFGQGFFYVHSKRKKALQEIK
jgi:uncharacterized membrane protein